MMQKKILGFVAFLFTVLLAHAQTYSYTVKGSFRAIDCSNEYVYLQYLDTSDWNLLTVDSTLVVNNKFEFTKNVDSSTNTLAFISTKDNRKVTPGFFIAEKGVIEMSLAQDSVKVGGTPLNDEYQVLRDSLWYKTERIIALSNDPMINQVGKVARIDAEMQKLNNEASAYINKYIATSIGEYFILTLSNVLQAQALLELISKTRPEFQDKEYVKSLSQASEAQRLKTVGGLYKDLRLKNPAGKQIALSDYVGKSKYILLDFWASWCRPCLNEMPVLAEAYKKYKSKGFEIIGISLDSSASAWQNVISQKQLTWPQMSDLKGTDSEAGKIYQISTIPFTLLLDVEGKIVATDLRGQSLLNKLEELLNK